MKMVWLNYLPRQNPEKQPSGTIYLRNGEDYKAVSNPTSKFKKRTISVTV